MVIPALNSSLSPMIGLNSGIGLGNRRPPLIRSFSFSSSTAPAEATRLSVTW